MGKWFLDCLKKCIKDDSLIYDLRLMKHRYEHNDEGEIYFSLAIDTYRNKFISEHFWASNKLVFHTKNKEDPVYLAQNRTDKLADIFGIHQKT